MTIYPDRLTFNFNLGLPDAIVIDRPYLFERGERLPQAAWDKRESKASRQAKLDHAAAAAQSP
jgi:hypothetical protein